MSQDGQRGLSPFDADTTFGLPSTPAAKPPLLIAPRSATIARPIKSAPSNPFDTFEIPSKAAGKTATSTIAIKQQTIATSSITKADSKIDLSTFRIPEIPMPAHLPVRPAVRQPQQPPLPSSDPWGDFANTAALSNQTSSRQHHVSAAAVDPWSSASEKNSQRSVSQPVSSNNAVANAPSFPSDDPWAAFSNNANASSAGDGNEEMVAAADKKGKKKGGKEEKDEKKRFKKDKKEFTPTRVKKDFTGRSFTYTYNSTNTRALIIILSLPFLVGRGGAADRLYEPSDQ